MEVNWATLLPAVDASLNALATLLLLVGLRQIKKGRREAHRRTMLITFVVSAIFLTCYLVHHAMHGSKTFGGVGLIKPVYYSILISHVFLAVFVAVLVPVTVWKGLKADKAEKLGQPSIWAKHRKIAKVTFPLWLYVSVTGVVIYFLAYHWPSS